MGREMWSSSSVGLRIQACFRMIAQLRIVYVENFSSMAVAGDGLKTGPGESAEFPTRVKEGLAMFAVVEDGIEFERQTMRVGYDMPTKRPCR